MMLFHPQWVEIVSFLAPYLRIQAEQKQPQEPVWYWPSSYPGNRDQWRKGIPETSSPAQTLAMHWSETTFYFPSCYLKGIVDLASPWLRQLQGNLFETWGCFLCKLEERCPSLGKDKGHWKEIVSAFATDATLAFSGNFLVSLSSTTSQMIAGFH